MSNLSAFLANPQPQLTLTASSGISQGQVVNIGPDGLVFPASCSDTAANATLGSVIASTSLSAEYIQPYGNSTGFIQDSSGKYYCLSTITTNANGLVLSKYSSAGALISTVTIDGTSAATTSPNLFFLSNGNICVTWGIASGSYGYYAICTPSLTSVVSKTALNGAGSSSIYPVSCPISGGGFAVFYRTASTTAEVDTYNNAGTYQTNATVTVYTSNTTDLCIAQLSNSNIVIGFSTSGTQYQFAIYNTSLVQQVAPTNSVAPSTSGQRQFISTVTGYFAIAVGYIGAATKVAVFNNAGAQQGSTFVSGAGYSYGIGIGLFSYQLVNDGTNFWAVYTTYVTYAVPNWTKITTAGATTTYSGVTCGSAVMGNLSTTPPDTRGGIHTCIGGGGSGVYYEFNVNSGVVESNGTVTTVGSYWGAGSTTSVLWPSMIAIGDASFAIFGGTNASPSIANIATYNQINKSIIGISTSTAAAGGVVSVDTTSGVKALTTALPGTQPKTFTFAAATIYGNAGTLIGAGVVQKGM